MTEKMNQNSDWEQEPKTYESVPVTQEELDAIKNNLYVDDIDGGLHNIEVPEEAMKELIELEKKASQFIDFDEDGRLPNSNDGVKTSFTPDQLMLLLEIIKLFSLDMKSLNYAKDVLNIDNLYEQQTLVRKLHDYIDNYIDNYIKLRPYNPLFESWVKKTGRKNEKV